MFSIETYKPLSFVHKSIVEKVKSPYNSFSWYDIDGITWKSFKVQMEYTVAAFLLIQNQNVSKYGEKGQIKRIRFSSC